jgi:hypothetical protein
MAPFPLFLSFTFLLRRLAPWRERICISYQRLSIRQVHFNAHFLRIYVGISGLERFLIAFCLYLYIANSTWLDER